MVASVQNPIFTRRLLSPGPESTDSDHVTVALQAARALEGRGDLVEAAHWLHHAADAAERDGDPRRQIDFFSAAAELRRLSTAPPPAAAGPVTLAPPASTPAGERNSVQPPLANPSGRS